MRRKKLFTMALAAAFLAGQGMSGITALADAPATTGSGTGTGHNEGTLPEYPEIGEFTFPTTAPTGAYNYLIDPNGMIGRVTTNGHYGDAQFNQSATLFFENEDKNDNGSTFTFYTNVSKALTVVNESARDMEIAVKVTADADYDGDVEFSESADFGDSTDKLIYIAAAGTTQTANAANTDLGSKEAVAAQAVKGLAAANQAALTLELPGNQNNYELTYNSTTSKYAYAEKDSDDQGPWSVGTFYLTGACNTQEGTEWGSDELPELSVTWSWAEKVDAKEVAMSFANYSFYIANGASADDKFAAGTTFTDMKLSVNGVEKTVNAALTNGYIVIATSDLTSAFTSSELVTTTGTKYTATFKVDNVKYKAVYTME